MKTNIFWAVILVLSFLILYTPQHVFAAPPDGFQTSLVVGSGLTEPTGFEFAPDGRIFIIQREGAVKIYKNGQLLSQDFIDFSAVASGDRGLIGIAFDPDFTTNHFVYFYYTDSNDLLNRLVRLDASGDVAKGSPVVLYQTSEPSQQLHVGGTIRFDNNGKLFLSIGDNGHPANAQDLTNPHGKILRLNKDGTIPTDNPFVNTPNALPEIWAYGLRNPFRFQFDSITNNLLEGDVGQNTWEEINHIVKGGNYGWPVCEGLCNPPDPTKIDPIYYWNHNQQSAAAVGGPIYRGQMFPDDYKGRLFFGDYALGFIKTMTLDANANSTGVQDFDVNAGSVVDMKVDAKDGSLYYLDIYPGALYRITYANTQVPVANATADIKKGQNPLTVHFSSNGSIDPNNLPLTYTWDFGDNSSSTNANPTKVYNNKGKYIVQLKVSNGKNSALANPIVIQVGIPPKVTIGEPTDGTTYKAGDLIHYTASAIDGAGFDLNDNDISTTIVFHHQTHIHPFIGPLIGRNGQFTIPNNGESSAETWYEIDVTATDTNGLTTTAVANIYPLKSIMTLNTNPSGLSVVIDGIPTVTQAIIQGVVNFQRELFAPAVQVLGNISYSFNHWSDGLAERHTIATPSNDTAYTAFYDQTSSFTGEYFDNKTLSGTPKLTRQDPSINFNWQLGSPDNAIPSDNFSVRWTKKQYYPVGRYLFTTTADDGVRVYIDGNVIIDKWIDQAAKTYSAKVDLTDGNHTVVMEYYDHTEDAFAKLTWDYASDQPTPSVTLTPTPSAAVSPTPLPSDSYTAQYFDNQTLSGSPKLTRQDNDINFNWGIGSPDPSIPNDHFSARWTKKQTFADGTYQFTTSSDDGVRVFIDGTKIIDKWIDQPERAYTATQALTAGDHTLAVEYYDNTEDAVMKFNFIKINNVTPTPTFTPTPTSTPSSDVYQTKFWNVPGTGSSPTIPTTAPVLTRTDTDINYSWGLASPGTGINADHFIAQWVKNQIFEDGTYHFTTVSDDGIRVFLDNQALIDQWNDHGEKTFTADKAITGGIHVVRVEFYDNTEDATAKFSFVKLTPTPTPSTDVYQTKFWNVPGTGSSPSIPTSSPVLTRTDTDINFSWGLTSPGQGVSTDHFIAQWIKDQTFEDGTYHFTTTSDDGIRVYIDNQVLINQWNDHAEKLFTADKILTAGIHNVRVEFYDNTEDATAKFSFTKVTTAANTLKALSPLVITTITLSPTVPATPSATPTILLSPTLTSTVSPTPPNTTKSASVSGSKL